MNTALDEIETMLRQRPDCVAVKRGELENDSYLSLELRGVKQKRNHHLIIQPIATERGHVLRIFHLDAAIAPRELRCGRFCAALNQKTWFGSFSDANAADGLIAFTLYHIQSSACPEANILNRLIDEALIASDFCESVIRDLVTQAPQPFFPYTAKLQPNPSLN